MGFATLVWAQREWTLSVAAAELVPLGDVTGGSISHLVTSWFKVDVLSSGAECVHTEAEHAYNLWGCTMVAKIRPSCQNNW